MTDPNWQVGIPELVQSYYLPTPIDDKVLGWLDGELVNVDQVVPPPQDITATWCGTAGGSANAILLTPTTAITSYVAGQMFRFEAASANTSTVTVSVSALSAKAVNAIGGNALAAGDIVPGLVSIVYNGTYFEVESVVPFKQSGAGSIIRTQADKLREVAISITDKGGLMDDSTDCLAAFNSCNTSLPSTGGIIHIPSGVARVSGAADAYTGKRIRLVGEGKGVSIVKTTHATANVFTFDIAYCGAEAMSFEATVTRTSGSYIDITKNCSHATIRDFYMDEGFYGITGTCVNDVIMQDGTIFNTAANGIGIRLIGDGVTPAGNSIRIDNVTMSGDTNDATRIGIQITNVGDVNITNCDIIRHGTDLSITPGTGEVATAIYAVNTYFDTATNGIFIVPTGSGTATQNHFIGCWIGSHTDHGIVLGSSGTVSGTEFDCCHIYSNGVRGVLIDGGFDTRFVGGAICGNTGDGVTVSANKSGFHFIGVRIGDGDSKPGNGGYGIDIAAGTSSDFSIIGCNLKGNTSGPLSNGATGGNQIIDKNIGFAKTPTVVIATPYTMTGADDYITVNVGSLTTITLLSPSTFSGMQVLIRSVNSSVQSGSSNVVPIGGGAAGNTILTAAGKWALLLADGTNWQIMQAN